MWVLHTECTEVNVEDKATSWSVPGEPASRKSRSQQQQEQGLGKMLVCAGRQSFACPRELPLADASISSGSWNLQADQMQDHMQPVVSP